MPNLAVSVAFPSETPGAILDVKKGRSTIPFTMDELEFVSNFHSLLAVTGVTDNVKPEASNNVIDITPISAETLNS